MRLDETQPEIPEGEDRRQIRTLLYVVRWLAIVYVILAAQIHFDGVAIERTPIVVSASAVGLFTLLVALGERRFRRFRGPLLLTIVDVGLVGLIVLFSDGIQSPFYPLFYVTLIEAAAAFGTRGALSCAGVITVLSFLAEAADTRQTLTEPRVLADFARTVPYLFIIAVITGALRDRIRALAGTAATLRTRQEGVERDLAMARRVQRAQLPTHVPEMDGASIIVVYEPAREVGGDLYDFYPVTADTLGVTIADVSGKGVPAALLVASAKYAVRQHASDDRPAMMRQVNQRILSETAEDAFVALLQGTVDIARREFRYANGGQMPPIVLRASTGKAEIIEGCGLPLGVMDSAEYTELKTELEPGDTLVLYTDGATDALGLGGDGLEAFRRLIESLAEADLESWRETILAAAKEPTRSDDVTVVAVRLTP